MKIKCLVVDDEELAQNILERFISTIPTLDLVKKCDNAIEAISYLHNNEIDLIFLDINMPELSGLDMLKTFAKPPMVILTTAYTEYAIESYEFGVVDYLLKPIKLERFIKAVNKVVELFDKKSDYTDHSIIEESKLLIKDDQATYQLEQSDINFIEAYGNYLKIHTDQKTYVVRETMQNISNELNKNNFLRIHKSFIVHLKKISKICGNTLYLNTDEIPVGASYKSELMKRLKNN